MAIAIDNTTTVFSTGFNTMPTLTWAHAVNGSNRSLLVYVSTDAGSTQANTVTSVTYNGTALTLVGASLADESGAGKVRLELWSLINPPTGTYNVQVVANDIGHIACTAISLTGVEPYAPEVVATNTLFTDGTVYTHSADSATSGAMVLGASAHNLESSMSITTGGTLLATVASTDSGGGNRMSLAQSTTAAPATHTFSWTAGATFGRVAGIIVSIVPLGAVVFNASGPIDQAIIQRSSLTHGSISIAGTYNGPGVTIQGRIRSGATVVVDWTNLTKSGTTYSGAISAIPVGYGYSFDVRALDGGSSQLSILEGDAIFGIGALLLVAGSSTPQKWLSSASDPTDEIPNSINKKFTGSSWTVVEGNSAIRFTNEIVAYHPGIPIGLIDTGLGGTTLIQWYLTTDPNYIRSVTYTAAAGNVLEGIIVHIGSNDARSEIVYDILEHQTRYQTLITNWRATFIKAAFLATIPVYVMGCQRAQAEPDSSNAFWSRARSAEIRMVNSGTNMYYINVTDLPLIGGELVHLDYNAMKTLANRVAKHYRKVIYGTTLDNNGPLLTSVTYNDSTGVVEATFDLRGGTCLTSRNGTLTGITGFAISKTQFNSYLPVYGATIVSPTKVHVYVDPGLSWCQVQYMGGTQPDNTNCLFNNVP